MYDLEKQAELLAENIRGWETSTLQRIGKRINKTGKLSIEELKVINNIADVKNDMGVVIKQLSTVTRKNISQINKIYSDFITEQHLENEPLYNYRNKKFVPFAENKKLQSIVKAYSKTTAETMLNLSKTKLLCIRNEKGQFVKLQKGYTDILDKATIQATTATTDFPTAMRETIKQLGSGGLRVNYGGGITRRLDTVVRQNLLWGAKQASIEYNETIGEELGCDGIEIDYHANPRPSHEFMQGKQFVLGKSRKVNGIYFEGAEEALKRLEDYGCNHYKAPIICGISEPRYSKKELAELKQNDKKTYNIDGKKVTGYEASQMMRRLETAIREQKGLKAAAKASGDNSLAKESNKAIQKYQEKYSEISKTTGIKEDKNRISYTKK
nr:MAG TPA: minor capsid protein [Caudoviricetes sp.]